MKRRLLGGLSLLLALLLPAAAGAQDLPLEELGEAPATLRGPLREALYVEVELLGHKALSPRPTVEARRRLEKLAGSRPGDPVVQRYLARAQADLGAHREAEAALRLAESRGPDELWPLEDLAHYSASRGNWSGQLGALKRLAARRESRLDLPGERERLAGDLRRIAKVIEDHQIEEDPLRYRRQAAELFPQSYDPGEEVIRWLIDQGREEEALAQFPWARRLNPEDRDSLTRQELELLFRLERPAQARAVMLQEIAEDDGLRRGWIWESYVRMLQARGELEAELRRVRAAVRDDPRPGVPLAEAVHLLLEEDQRAEVVSLLERALEHADEATDDELLGLSVLLLAAGQGDDALGLLRRVVVTSRGEARDLAQVRLALLLAEGQGEVPPSGLVALLEPSRLDPGPSVAGGVLSLLLTSPPGSEAASELRRRDRRHLQASLSAALFDDLTRRRPGWEPLPRLEQRLIETYRAFGADQVAYQASKRFLERHPDHQEYFDVGLGAVELAEGLEQSPEPLLRQLEKRAVSRADDASHRRVLRAWEQLLSHDRGRYVEVVGIYWTAIEARPDDVQLYNDLLRFTEQRNLREEQEQVYRRAMERFRGSDWASRYGSWLLRHQGQEAGRALTRRLLEELGPGELSRYLQEAVRASYGRSGQEELANTFFLEIHREALRRHPQSITIARRLLAYYDQRRRQHGEDRLGLLVRFAPYDGQMRDELFATLAREGRLGEALEQLSADSSASGRLLAADYLLRRASHSEARQALAVVRSELPGHRQVALRLSTLEGALGHAERAREIVEELLGRWPVDASLLTRAGELAMEGDDVEAARRAWVRIHEASAGDPQSYLRAATLFWDYFLFDDAARTLITAREAVSDENLFAFQLAAVHESAGRQEPAVREYLRVLAAAASRADSWPPYQLRPRPPDRGDPEDFDEYDEGESSLSDDSLVYCMDRLVQLASRPGDREIVEAVFRDVLTNSANDHGLVHIRVDLLERTDRWDQAQGLLAEASLRLSSSSLQERAIRELRSAGREREATAVLSRLAQNRPTDLQPTFRLAGYLESRGHVQSAARALTDLAQRLSGDETRRRDESAVQERLARVLFTHQRYEPALEAGQRALAGAEGRRAQSLRLTLARWLQRMGRSEDALAALAPVLAEDPSASDALDLFAEASTAVARRGGQGRQQVVAMLLEAFNEAIEEVRQESSSWAERREHELRETLTSHLLKIGAHRAVLDQQVAMLNANLEDRALLRRAHRHAAAQGLLENLERRYQRDAERSPRDHRLPLVLARLAAEERHYDRAAELIERTLQVAPERLDLRQEMIGYLVRQASASLSRGAWVAVAQQYHRLAELDSDPRWVTAEAQMYGRAGDFRAMDEAVLRLLALDMSRPERYIEAAQLYATAARWPQAWTQVEEYLGFWLEVARSTTTPWQDYRHRTLELDRCVEIAVRAGRWREIQGALEHLEILFHDLALQRGVNDSSSTALLANQVRLARTDQLAEALRRYGVDHDQRGFVDGLRQELSRVEQASGADLLTDSRPMSAVLREYQDVAALATKAGAPRRELDLLREVGDGLAPADRSLLLRGLVERLAQIGAAREAQALLEQSPDMMEEPERWGFVLQTTAALGDRQGEERALLALLERRSEPNFNQRTPLLERLLTLRWSAGDESRGSIPQLVDPGETLGGQVINFLIQQGDYPGARAALERYGQGEATSLWMDASRARLMLHEARQGAAPTEHSPFTHALDLRTIDELVEGPTNRNKSLGREAWVEMAQAYGEALARAEAQGQTPPAGRRQLIHAQIEQSPRSAEAQQHLAREALSRSEPDLAISHYRLAQELEPRSAQIRNGLAQALLAAGRRDEAIALWDQVAGGCRTERCIGSVATAMVQAGEDEAGIARLTRFLRDRWRTGSLSLRLLEQLASLLGEAGRERGGAMDQLLWELWQVDRDNTELLRAAAGVEQGSNGGLVIGRARGRYLRQGLREPITLSYESAQWLSAYLDYLLELDEHRVLLELVERAEAEAEADGSELPQTIRLARVRGLLGVGRREAALASLRELAEEVRDPQSTVRFLREHDLEAEAFEFQLTWAQDRIEAGDEGRSVYLAAVEALLLLDRGAEADSLARQAFGLRADDLDLLRPLAALLGEHERTDQALRVRRLIQQITRSDHENLLALARLEMEAGQLENARRRGLSLLARWAVPAEVEDGASELLVELSLNDRSQRRQVTAALTAALDDRALDEDRALTLARVHHQQRNRRAAQVVLERAIREAAAPWRSLQLLASWEARGDDLEVAERRLESALVHADGSMEVRRQLFLVRRRLGHHQAALAILGVTMDRAAGVSMLRGLEEDEAIALVIEVADSAVQLGWWAAADAYTSEALDRIDRDDDEESHQQERERLAVIRSHLDLRRASAQGRPWIRRPR